MSTPRASRFTFYALLLFLFILHSLFYFFALGNDAVDDAYISFRYAQNAIHGYGLAFNPNERVEGFTNFLWTALMVPLEGARVDIGRASMLLDVLFALGVIVLVIRFSRIVGAPRAVGVLAALLLAADGSFALWGVGGLETPMFAFLIFAGAVLYIREQRWDAGLQEKPSSVLPVVRKKLGWVFPYSGIFFALAAMTRPEGVFVFAITAAHQAAWRILTERRLFTRRDIERVIAFTAIFVPYWLGRWAYYHSFLPNSFHAKVNTTGPAAQIERGWNHLSQFVNVHLGWVLLLPPLAIVFMSHLPWRAVPGLRATPAQHHTAFSASDRSKPLEALGPPATLIPKAQRRGRAWSQTPRHLRGMAASYGGVPPAFWTTYFAAIIILYVAYIVYVGGDWSVGRFFVPLLAPFYLLFSTGLVDLWNWCVEKIKFTVDARPRVAHILGITVSGLLAIAVFLASSWNGEYGIYIGGFNAAQATQARETMGRWLKANVPRGTLIAVDAAGQVPYFAELPAVDMFGINDLYIGRMNVETLGKGTPGHEKIDLTYIILRKPEYVIIYGGLFDTIKEYERASATWTSDQELNKFLTLYRRRAP